MIAPQKIEEWIREAEERPASSALIIRYLANRLSELSAREEELAAQNIELLSGRKVEEYENRIASLEYQLELLKRQLGGEAILPVEVTKPAPLAEKIDLLLYNPLGQVLRVELEPAELPANIEIARLTGELAQGGNQPAVLATTSQEELLFIFDSGRVVAHPVSHLPPCSAGDLDWGDAFLEEPRVKEQLAAIVPIAKMSLYEQCIQASRRGYVKKMKSTFFAAHLAEGYIGSGVKIRADKTCGLAFALKNDLFIMVSLEGYIFSMPAEHLPSAIEEVLRLGITDHIVAAFVMGGKPSILFVTQNGKAVHREASWLEAASSFKTKGQALLSKERRAGGTRIVGAAPVGEADWGVCLHGDGKLTIHQLGELQATGSVFHAQPAGEILSFATFQMPEQAR